MLLKELLSLNAPSGCEDAVRDFLLKNISADEITVDTMGNIIAHKKGKGKRVMFAAHMDEVGIIITKINSDGTLGFQTVGGIDSAVLCGKRFVIGKSGITGISGIKAVHLQDDDERKTPCKVDKLYIDIGAKDAEDAKKYVSLGDYGTFDGAPVEFGNRLLKSKALDDRVGCAVLAELLKEDTSLDFYAVFSTQEEVGCRGAQIAANRIAPEIGIVLEGTTCSDVYGTPKHLAVTKLGGGAALTVIDGAAAANRELLDLIIRTAKRDGIAYQLKRTTAGGTDAGAIQRSAVGAKTAVISVPCRYIHSPISVMSLNDFDSVVSLSKAVLKELEV